MSSETVVAHTKYGPVRGKKRTSTFGEQFISFQGIPYAKAPVGELRFRDPKEPEPWVGVLDATKQGPSGFNYNILLDVVEGSEDCLHINVYSKDLKPKTLRPVIVFIHGGGFMCGSSGEEVYGPDYMMQKDIVFVSMNYRLGAFGFLSCDDADLHIPGNAGLKDQSLALKWVRDNISYFGGNACNVTISGESAGGASVNYHLVSQMSQFLFQKAIIQSGSVFNPWALSPPHNWLQRLATKLGWNGEGGNKAAAAVLQAASPNDITMQQEQLVTDEEKLKGVLFPFGPVIEPYVSAQTFIPRSLDLMSRNAWSANVPLMIGGTAHEGLYVYKDAEFFIKNCGDFQNQLLLDMNLECKSPESQAIGGAIKKFYFGDQEPNMDMVDAFIDFNSDKLFWHGVFRTVMLRLAHAKAPTYLYRFDFDGGNFNIFRGFFAPETSGTCHADELAYLYNNIISEPVKLNSKQHKTIERMIGLWASFASTGNPNCQETKDVTWKPLEADNDESLDCLNISDELSIIELPETKRMQFWESLYAKL